MSMRVNIKNTYTNNLAATIDYKVNEAKLIFNMIYL